MFCLEEQKIIDEAIEVEKKKRIELAKKSEEQKRQLKAFNDKRRLQTLKDDLTKRNNELNDLLLQIKKETENLEVLKKIKGDQTIKPSTETKQSFVMIEPSIEIKPTIQIEQRTQIKKPINVLTYNIGVSIVEKKRCNTCPDNIIKNINGIQNLDFIALQDVTDMAVNHLYSTSTRSISISFYRLNILFQR